MGAKLALLAALFGGSLEAQQPQPFKGLAVPPGYRQHAPAANQQQQQPPTRAKGVINPKADRAPVAGAGGQVMYFHKPAGAFSPDGDAGPVAAEPGVVPSVLPEAMSPLDNRLAQAPPPPPARSVYEFQPRPTVADTPVGFPPAAARSEAPTPAPAPLPGMVRTLPTPETGMRYTSQKQPDVVKQPDETPEQKEARMKVDRDKATRLPARDKIFVLYDDQQLEQAIVASVKKDVYNMKRAPDTPPPSVPDEFWKFPELARIVPEGTVYEAKTSQYPPRTECYEPAWVVHRRLNFEQKNFEREGWDLGIAQPVVSTLVFYKDVLFWPHNLASGVHNCFDTNVGKCLPGSPAPFYLYPPEFTTTGTVAEIGLVTATVFIFP